MNAEDIKRGDIFQLGTHRIMCGDSCSLIDVQKLMNGYAAELLFTDPPYNIDYIPENRRAGGRKVNTLGGIMNDQGQFDHQKWFQILETGIVKGSFYITNIYKNFHHIYPWLTKHCGRECSVLLWIKGNHVLSRTDYHKSYEIIFYNRTNEGVWNGGRDQKAEWYVKQANVNDYRHPTQKPIRLVQKAILNNSNPGDIVLDMFIGSGSTLIACQQNDRVCFGLELDAKYVKVAIERWEDYTGQKAIKLV